MDTIKELLNINKNFLFAKPVLMQNWQWLSLTFLLFIGLLLSYTLTALFNHALRKFLIQLHILKSIAPEKRKTFLERPLQLTIMGWIWMIGLPFLKLEQQVNTPLLLAVKIVTYYGILLTIWRFADLLHIYMKEKAKKTKSKIDDLIAPLISRSIKIVCIIFGSLFITDIFNLPLAGVLTGVGVGGAAIAFAAQDSIANIFGSATVVFDQPFHIGDWVKIDDAEGTVESLGFRSTKIRTFYNSVIVVPNSVILKASIDNYGKREFRRLKCNLSLTYDTPPDKVEAFCKEVRNIIKKHPRTRKDYFHVYLNSFNDSSIDVLLYCFFKVPDWGVELEARHDLLIGIMKCAENLGVEFAFPTRTLIMNKPEDLNG